MNPRSWKVKVGLDQSVIPLKDGFVKSFLLLIISQDLMLQPVELAVEDQLVIILLKLKIASWSNSGVCLVCNISNIINSTPAPIQCTPKSYMPTAGTNSLLHHMPRWDFPQTLKHKGTKKQTREISKLTFLINI